MLEDMRQIDWQALNVPALPDWIEATLSSDEAIREQAYNEIYDAHLDDLHRASPYLVPILIELLDNPATQAQSYLLLLMQISYSAQSGIESSYAPRRLLANATIEAIEKGFEKYLSFLDHDELLLNAVELLTSLEHEASRIIPHFLRLLNDRVMSIYEKTTIIHGIRILSPKKVQYPILMSYLSDFHIPEVQLSAAKAIVHIQGTDAPLLVDGIFTYYLVHPPKNRFYLTALENLGLARADNILTQVLANDEIDDETTVSVISALLELGFHGGKIRDHMTYRDRDSGAIKLSYHTLDYPKKIDFANLEDYQHHVLKAILDCDAFWRLTCTISEIYGLPKTRAELAMLLGTDR